MTEAPYVAADRAFGARRDCQRPVACGGRACLYANSPTAGLNLSSEATSLTPLSYSRLAFRLVAEAVHQRLILAAVDLNHGAVDHFHQRGSEHGNEVGHLFDLRNAAHRD